MLKIVIQRNREFSSHDLVLGTSKYALVSPSSHIIKLTNSENFGANEFLLVLIRVKEIALRYTVRVSSHCFTEMKKLMT